MMDRAQLIAAISESLRRVPPYIAAASIQEVGDFKKWHNKTSKGLQKSNLYQLQATYLEVQAKYRAMTALS